MLSVIIKLSFLMLSFIIRLIFIIILIVKKVSKYINMKLKTGPPFFSQYGGTSFKSAKINSSIEQHVLDKNARKQLF